MQKYLGLQGWLAVAMCSGVVAALHLLSYLATPDNSLFHGFLPFIKALIDFFTSALVALLVYKMIESKLAEDFHSQRIKEYQENIFSSQWIQNLYPDRRVEEILRFSLEKILKDSELVSVIITRLKSPNFSVVLYDYNETTYTEKCDDSYFYLDMEVSYERTPVPEEIFFGCRAVAAHQQISVMNDIKFELSWFFPLPKEQTHLPPQAFDIQELGIDGEDDAFEVLDKDTPDDQSNNNINKVIFKYKVPNKHLGKEKIRIRYKLRVKQPRYISGYSVTRPYPIKGFSCTFITSHVPSISACHVFGGGLDGASKTHIHDAFEPIKIIKTNGWLLPRRQVVFSWREELQRF